MPKKDLLKKIDARHQGTILNSISSSYGGTSDDANTVDDFHAYQSPIPNSLLALDEDSKFPDGAMPDTVVRSHDMDLELMKISFQSLSWSQFAIFDNFYSDEKRWDYGGTTPPGFTAPSYYYLCKITDGMLTHGDDETGDRVFTFDSKAYPDITTVLSSTSTSVGSGYLEDTAASWFVDQYKGFVLVDSADTEFTISGCTESPRRLTVTGTPASGAYSIRSINPTVCVGFCTFLDSSNGGYGYTKLEITFDGGTNWQTLLDTSSAINTLGGIVTITNSGVNYMFKVTITNDADGNGPEVYKVLICTDPSVWQ